MRITSSLAIISATLLASSQPAMALDSSTYAGNYGPNDFAQFQIVSDKYLIYCNRSIGENATGCYRLNYLKKGEVITADWPQASRTLRFEKIGSRYLALSGEVTADLKPVSNRLSAKKFSGSWQGAATSFQRRSPRSIDYTYDKWDLKRDYKMVGDIAIGKVTYRGRPQTWYYVNDANIPNSAIVLNVHEDTGANWWVNLTAESFEYPKTKRGQSKCVQAHLNAFGFDVGKVDGAIGPATKAKAAEWKSSNSLDLPDLSNSNLSKWCVLMQKRANDMNLDATAYLF